MFSSFRRGAGSDSNIKNSVCAQAQHPTGKNERANYYRTFIIFRMTNLLASRAATSTYKDATMFKIIPIVFLALTGFQAYSMVFYVNQNAPAGGNGLSWAGAFRDLQSALSLAIPGDDIWVATGSYKPTTGTNRNYSFVMKAGVDLFGGFMGTETAINQRNINGAPTYLSGDIGQAGNASDNSYTVVHVGNLSDDVVIDGFRIVDGNSNDNGGGLYLHYSTGAYVYLLNCLVFNNYADDEGGGISLESGNIYIENCVLLDNTSGFSGGAINADTDPGGAESHVYVIGSILSGNLSTYGGGAIDYSSYDATLLLDRCILTANSGPGIIEVYGQYADIQLHNSSFIGNSASTHVLRLNVSNLECWLYNLTIADNINTYLQNSYGAIYLHQNFHEIRNCIIYGNTPDIGGLQIYGGGVVSNSIIEDGYPGGTNVLDADPQFVNPSAFGAGYFDATNYDYTCSLSSPAIDAGDSVYVISPLFKDLAGAPRIHGGNVDIGAYENHYCLLSTSLSISPDTVICAGDSAILTVNGGGNSFLWSNGETQPSITASASGNYHVTATDTSLGCRGITSVNISVLNAAVDITGDFTNCIGETATLFATGNNQSFQWSTGDTSSSISVITGGIYSVTAANAGGCSSTDQAGVIFNPNPVPGISFTEQSGIAANDSIVCAGDVVNFTATGGSAYIWNIGASGATITPHPTNTTSYFAEVINPSGCSVNSDTVTIFVLPNPSVTISGPTKRCEGQTATLTASGGTNQSYSWSTGAVGNIITANSTGSYSITANNGSGCTVTDNHFVTISSPHPEITLNEQSGKFNDDGVICAGDLVTLTATGGSLYNWTNNSSTAATIYETPPATTLYIVSTTDVGACTGRDTVTIEVHPTPVVNFSVQDSFLSNSPIVSLNNVSPMGGVFSGNDGISGNYFDPRTVFPGQYNIIYTYTDQNGCSNSVTQTVVVYLSTSVFIQPPASFKIFPNPVINKLHIICSDKQIHHYCFTDRLGKEIYDGEFMNEFSMEISTLVSGIYFLHIGDNSWLIFKP